jgi:chemotaxis protein methyltransferase CheR
MTLTADQSRRFADMVEDRLGVRVGDRPVAIAEIVGRRAAARHQTLAAYVLQLDKTDADELRALASEISVGETYFFRHTEQFQAYADALPELVARGGRVHVLSAGCSSGEEPYTLAILAHERVDPRTMAVEGIDMNVEALARARRGLYTRWALRATTAEHEARWFAPVLRELELARTIRDSVTFSEANLVDPRASWATRPWHVVFCRNVLMYLTEQHASSLVERFVNALVPGGYLFVGHAEMLRDYGTLGLELCHTHGAFYYRRAARGVADTAARNVLEPVAPPSSLADGRWVEEIGAASKRVEAIVDGALAGGATTKAAAAPTAMSIAAIRALIREERFADALAAIARLPAAVANTSDVILIRAVVATQTGDAATVETTCRELMADPGLRGSASYLQSICADANGDVAASERLAREALADDPSFAMASMQLAFLASRRRDRAAAAESFDRAISLLQGESDARLELFAGGFSRATLLRMCHTELQTLRGRA